MIVSLVILFYDITNELKQNELTPRQKRIKYFLDNEFRQRVSDNLMWIIRDTCKQRQKLYPFLTLKTIEDNIDADWDWPHLAVNANLTLEFITKYAHKFELWAVTNELLVNAPLLLYYMCHITKIDKHDITALYPSILSCSQIGTAKEDLYANVVFSHNSYYNWGTILDAGTNPLAMFDEDKFPKCHDLTYKTISWMIEWTYMEYMAAYRIQQWWLKITTNPYHKVGRRIIEKRFDELAALS
jgi:hypothetical protein